MTGSFLPAPFRCEECSRIARALQQAWHADRRAVRAKLQEVAASSGRDPQRLGVGWIFSLAKMPDDEMKNLLDVHYPNLARAREERAQHEAATGHAVPLNAWWILTAYGGGEELE